MVGEREVLILPNRSEHVSNTLDNCLILDRLLQLAQDCGVQRSGDYKSVVRSARVVPNGHVCAGRIGGHAGGTGRSKTERFTRSVSRRLVPAPCSAFPLRFRRQPHFHRFAIFAGLIRIDPLDR